MGMEKDDSTLNDDYEKAKTWTITYNANGGMNAPPSQTANVGQSITITSSKPTRNGYTFLGWSTWSGATEPETAYTPGYSYMSDYNLTLYAVWRKNQTTQYSLSFSLQGGNGTFNPLYGEYGNRVQIPYTKPTKTGYTFLGWATYVGGSASYQPGEYYTLYGNMTFYAVWKQNVVKTWSIIYNANGGTNAPEKQTANVGQSIIITQDKPIRSGYTFLGWSTWYGATEPETAYTPGYSYKSEYDTTLYAVWREVPKKTFTITYNKNTIDTVIGMPTNQTKTEGIGISLSKEVPVRSGYVFIHWSESSSDNGISYNPGGTYTKDSNVTLYAIWKQEHENMYIGSSSVSSIYIGSNKVSAMYIGTTKIW